MKKIKDKQIKVNYSFSLFSFIRRFAGIGAIVVLALFFWNKQQDYDELLQLNKVVTEELQVTKNEKGELTARIGAFQTQKADDFVKFATKDSLTLELQKEVKAMKKYLKRQGSVTKFSTESNVQTTSKTQVERDSTEFPTYKSTFDLDGWVFGNSIATKDSTLYNIGYKDDYSLTIGVEPTGFLNLGKGKPFAEITSLNPYNTVKTLKTYQVSLPPKRWFSVAPSINLGYDITGKTVITGGISVQLEKLSIKF